MEQTCQECKYVKGSTKDEPCFSCEWDEAKLTLSNFTPKKDLNKMLREKLGEDKPVYNPVSKPSHYMLKEGLEVRDVLELLAGKIASSTEYPWDTKHLFISDYVQMMQYLMRFMDKNGKQDLEKARWYLDKLIEAYE